MKTHRFRKNISDKGLREYFNTRDHTPKRKYSLDEYTNLRHQYTGLIELHKERQRLHRNEVQRTKREATLFLTTVGNVAQPVIFKPLKNNKPKLAMSKLGSYVDYWYKKNHKSNYHFTIKLQSQLAPDVKNIFKFTHINHFNSWYEKVKNETYVLTSESWGETSMPDTEEFYNLFEKVVVDDIKFVGGGCNKHSAGEKKFKSPFYDFKLYNPQSMNNNCFFKCLEYILKEKIDITKLRKQYNIETKKEVCINDAYKLINHFNLNVLIIDEFYNDEMEDEQKYILLLNNHYYVVQSFEEIIRKEKSTKRGLMTFDFETRKTCDYHLIKASNTKSFILKDALACVYYRPYKSTTILQKTLVSNNEKSSARQFLDFLNQEARQNRSYNVIAHNGGKFDFYFLISVMTDQEIKDAEIQLRGTTVISLNFRGNLFKDSCCFLTDSLANLSNSFKIENGKIVKFELHGENISSSQLCFYQPQLNFNDFLNLETQDPEYWKLYVKYCMYDCIALFEIWEKFTVCINTLIEKISPFLLRKCPLMSSSTIGSHSKKILVETNKFDGKISYDRRQIQKFTGLTFETDLSSNNVVEKWDMEKYKFLCKFKRGGISHCHKPGKHESGITGVDIASQYPASLIHSYIPTGQSEWIDYYNKDMYGFYHLKNLVFKTKYRLKPVALVNENKVLNWATDNMDELYADSYMLKYIIDKFGLESFDVVVGLVSHQEIKAEKIFGKYINSFYKEKQRQDALYVRKDNLYNPALRTTIKLYINSLTGKLAENPSIHFSLKVNDNSKLTLNGVGVSREYHEDKVNDWIVCGIMVYSYSKRLLFEYIKCLPDNSNDVIHIETDGIYFSTRHLEKFTENLNNYKGNYPCKYGESLGNLKIEKTTYEKQTAYFLGKKFYCITMPDGKNIMRIKGIPQSTIDEYGNKIQLVDTELYDDIFKGKTQTREFQTLRKALFTEKTQITAHTIKRTIRPNTKYSLYE